MCGVLRGVLAVLYEVGEVATSGGCVKGEFEQAEASRSDR